MAVVRCPACKKKGETPGDYRGNQVRCPRCGHRFHVAEADLTHEHNILDEEPPPLLPDPRTDRGTLELEASWKDWLARVAKHFGLESDEVLRRAVAEFARRNGFMEELPTRKPRP